MDNGQRTTEEGKRGNGYWITAKGERLEHFWIGRLSPKHSANRIPLPGHRGRHRHAYHDFVLDSLTMKFRKGVKKGYNQAQLGEAIRAALEEIGYQLLDKNSKVRRTLYKLKR